MKWEDCRKQKVKEIVPNKERAKSMRDLAVKRMESVKRRRETDAPEFILEDYYEIIKELITSLLFVKGFKSYSHECLISFLNEFYPQFSEIELKLIDQMRQTRNDLLYRGEPIASGFLIRRENEISNIIKKLLEEVDREL